MERLQGIVTRPQRLRPAQSSKVGGRRWVGRGRGRGRGVWRGLKPSPPPPAQIVSDHRAEFARCLEPLLLLGPRRAAGAGGGAST